MTPEPFTLHVPDEVLDDLQARLERVRWPDEVADAGWTLGTNLGYMRGLVEHWRDGFDWRAQEAKLNAFDQYTVDLDGIGLHFIHQPGRRAGPETAKVPATG